MTGKRTLLDYAKEPDRCRWETDVNGLHVVYWRAHGQTGLAVYRGNEMVWYSTNPSRVKKKIKVLKIEPGCQL